MLQALLVNMFRSNEPKSACFITRSNFELVRLHVQLYFITGSSLFWTWPSNPCYATSRLVGTRWYARVRLRLFRRLHSIMPSHTHTPMVITGGRIKVNVCCACEEASLVPMAKYSHSWLAFVDTKICFYDTHTHM